MDQYEILSKEAIRDRMIMEASKSWEITGVDSLDPLIIRLIEALASEIYHVSNAIEDIEIRLLEQIADTLTPDHFFSVKASHAIMKAYPLVNDEVIDQYTSFYTTKIPQIATNHSIQNIIYSPISPIKLIRANINKLICGHSLYQINSDNRKSLITRSLNLNESLNNTVYLGITLVDEIENLHNISFFIDFPTSPNRFEIIDLIPYIQWSVNDIELEMKIGLPDIGKINIDQDASIDKDLFFKAQNIDINHYYRKQFATIKSSIEVNPLKKEPIPSKVSHMFHERIQELEPQFWIRLDFPASFKSFDINNAEISLNAFPVVNRMLRSEGVNTKVNLLKIIPMPTSQGESFLGIESVSDSFGRNYHERPIQQKGSKSGGTYSIKKGGIERFGKREAKDLIQLVIDKYREEITSFASIYNDSMQNIFSQLGSMLNMITERLVLNETNIKEIPTYLILDSLYNDDDDRIVAKYWVTNHNLANGISKGQKFGLYTSSNLEKNSVVLLTTTKGGQKAPESTDKIRGYKYSLTTHDKIITHQDIEVYCHFKLGDKISYIQVKNGVMVSKKPKEGLIRTIDVYIHSANKDSYDILETIKNDLKVELELRSPNMYNYRLIIK